MHTWKIIDAADTKDGRLELGRRGDREFLITIDGRELMGSMDSSSEEELSLWGCGPIRDRAAPRVLTAGLGLGFTLRSALDNLPASAQVVVAELNPVIADWCRGPVAALTDDVLSDERVELVVGDVMDCVCDAGRGVRAPFDAIIVDLYEGPHRDALGELDVVYGESAIAAVRDALTDNGVYAVWGEHLEPEFLEDLQRAGFRASVVRPRGVGKHHVIYVAIKT